MKKNPLLFSDSARSNFLNLIGVTPFYYIFANNFLIYDSNMIIQPLKILSILLIHNFLFYVTHYSFHNFKSIAFIHHFHHKFNKPFPSSGNAVSLNEYNFAYVLPFLIGAFFIKPNDLSFRISIAIIGFLNSLIHCIPFYNLSIGKLFIKPGDHIEHHEKRTVKYAAPLLNIDYIVHFISNFINEKKKEYLR